MKVLFIQTGGTIDKDYRRGANVYNFEIAEHAAERIVKRANLGIECRFVSLLRKDSQDITNKDRQLIVKTCTEAAEDYIIITHGTDTMTKTGESLSAIKDKIIVLTGSSLPERFHNSDADFNLGMAVGALYGLSPGVYVVMHGHVLPWNKAQKDPETGQFVRT